IVAETLREKKKNQKINCLYRHGTSYIPCEKVPGSSPGVSRVIRRWGWSWRLWKNTYLITDIERLEMDSVVGRLVEKKRLNNLDYVE
ncbi:hypothetical protein, partial [Pantoea sp. ANP04]|uniref:hypothetical protein n=1 Tax=Pantoea sp. ANP04 TaxID=3064896 RepID=UPI0035C5FBC7